MAESTARTPNQTQYTTGDLVAANLQPLLRQQLACGAVRLTVRTGSMAPFLQPGDQVLVQAAAPTSLRRGDILLLATSTQPLLHRLLAVAWGSSGALLCTKGDAAPTCDPPFACSQLLGRVVAVERCGVHLPCGAATGRMGRWAGGCLAALSHAHARAHGGRVPRLGHAYVWLLRRGMVGLAAAAWWSPQFRPVPIRSREVQS
jgi:signal peptidase I